MVIKNKDEEIRSLEDIQKLSVKDLRDVLKSNSETAGRIKAALVLKVYALLMWNVTTPADNTQESVEMAGDFKCDKILRQISLLDGLQTCISFQN